MLCSSAVTATTDEHVGYCKVMRKLHHTVTAVVFRAIDPLTDSPIMTKYILEMVN